ncbi:MAG: radical SAM protein [Candidatus Omnitrophica bacterium]|nr:radical SAM protein [Candidatus Omnitrophota bacterium]
MKPDTHSKSGLDCLLAFAPKFKNFYKPIGEHMFTVILPMGLLSIADFVYKKGYHTQIVHLGLEKINNPRFSLKEYLKEVNPKVVGLSLHWHYQSYDTIEAAKEIKECNPGIFVVLGGLTASYFHEEIAREFSCIDGVIRGDGEVPLLRLLEALSIQERDFSNVPNFTWRGPEGIKTNKITYVAKQEDLDNSNFTNFDLLKNHKLYIKMQDMRGARWLTGVTNKILNKFRPAAYFPLLTHKGCPVNCSYCGGSKLSQKITCGRDDVAMRSIGKVVASIKEAQKYGYNEIYLSYLPLNNNNHYFEELFEAIKKAQTEMDYYLECPDLPPKRLIEAFNAIRHNGSKLYIGLSPETGSEEVRRFNKGFYYDNNELIETLKSINSFKIQVILYFSLGLPAETARDIDITLHFKEFLRENFPNIISISTVNPVLEPASLMHIYPEKYGIVKTRNTFKDFVLSSKDTNKEGFLTPRLGYFKQDFYPPGENGRLSREDSFRIYLQETICGSSCRLSDFIISDFLKTDNIFLKKIISKSSKSICNIISAFRGLCNRCLI